MAKQFLTLAAAVAATVMWGQAQPRGMVVDAGYQWAFSSKQYFFSPGQIVALFVHGVGASLTKPVSADRLPLPTTLAGISVGMRAAGLGRDLISLPLFRVAPVAACNSDGALIGCGSTTAIILQIPYELPTFPPRTAFPGFLVT